MTRRSTGVGRSVHERATGGGARSCRGDGVRHGGCRRGGGRGAGAVDPEAAVLRPAAGQHVLAAELRRGLHRGQVLLRVEAVIDARHFDDICSDAVDHSAKKCKMQNAKCKMQN